MIIIVLFDESFHSENYPYFMYAPFIIIIIIIIILFYLSKNYYYYYYFPECYVCFV